MNYELNFDEAGKFHGYQTVTTRVGESDVIECHYYTHGEFLDYMSFISVYPAAMGGRDFHAEDWGTMEITRDAAEGFAVDALPTYAEDYCFNTGHFIVKPMIEEALINA